MSVTDPSDISRSSAVRELIEARVKKVNDELARYEQIKAFALLERELTQDENELTPTLKVKRRIVHEHFKSVIEGMYAE